MGNWLEWGNDLKTKLYKRRQNGILRTLTHLYIQAYADS